jgi:hypothetical protein
MNTLTTQETLIPAAAGLDIAHANQRLRIHAVRGYDRSV